MLRPDIIDLREFYAGPLGAVARGLVRSRIRQIWPDLRGQRLLGLGYATPYLRPFLGEAERVLAMMPANQGVTHWPREGPGMAALAEETALPLPDAAIDRVLLVHALETTEHVRSLLREIWRVLTPSGRLLAVVPNRRGLWSRIENSPFAHGQPYTPPQLSRLMRDALFLPRRGAAALWLPPSEARLVLRWADGWERAGSVLWPRFSGVLLLEVEKQVYAATPVRAREAARRPVLDSVWQPAGPQPARTFRAADSEPTSPPG